MRASESGSAQGTGGTSSCVGALALPGALRTLGASTWVRGRLPFATPRRPLTSRVPLNRLAWFRGPLELFEDSRAGPQRGVGLISLLSVVTLRQDFAEAGGADSGSLNIAGQALVAFHDWTFLLGPAFCAGFGMRARPADLLIAQVPPIAGAERPSPRPHRVYASVILGVPSTAARGSAALLPSGRARVRAHRPRGHRRCDRRGATVPPALRAGSGTGRARGGRPA